MPHRISADNIGPNPRGKGRFNQPFAQQIDFFRRKLNLPTERFDDVIKSGHDRAFVVAGAMKADLIADLRTAVDGAIADGRSIGWFRKNFDEIVDRHGWAFRGPRNWRTLVIYQTNLQASYQAGRFAQLTDPDLLGRRPFWKYIHSDLVIRARPLHESWDGLVLRHDDPFWSTHFPPNGWGCRCRVQAVPPSQFKDQKAPDDGTRQHTDRLGVTHTIPNGIDFGWDYQPGARRSTPLKQMLDEKLIRLAAPVGARMMDSLADAMALEQQLQWSDTLDKWRRTKATGRVEVVGAVDAETVDWLQQQGNEMLSAEVAIRDRVIRSTRGRSGLTDSEWRRVADVIRNPARVLFDTRSGAIVYTADTDQVGTRISVAVDPTGRDTVHNQIVSGSRQSLDSINALIKSGIYRVIR